MRNFIDGNAYFFEFSGNFYFGRYSSKDNTFDCIDSKFSADACARVSEYVN
jgi:hypothetical protein